MREPRLAGHEEFVVVYQLAGITMRIDILETAIERQREQAAEVLVSFGAAP